MSEQKQTFDAICWLGARIILKRGALEHLVNDGLEEFMADCPYDDFTPEQEATVLAVLGNEQAIDALCDYWTAYDVGRLQGTIPDANAGADSPWLNGE